LYTAFVVNRLHDKREEVATALFFCSLTPEDHHRELTQPPKLE
jgi:hypothetical protein